MKFSNVLFVLVGAVVSMAFALPTIMHAEHHVPNYNVTIYNATATHPLIHLHPSIHPGHHNGPAPSTDPNASSDVTARDNLFSITLCDAPFRGGICTDQPMQNNICSYTPILSNSVSVYIPDRTLCQVYNNNACLLGNGNKAFLVGKNYDDLRGDIQREGDLEWVFPWWSWVCHNSIGE